LKKIKKDGKIVRRDLWVEYNSGWTTTKLSKILGWFVVWICMQRPRYPISEQITAITKYGK
jgi:hypothetical protein